MKNYVVESYKNYREEDRLTTNNARRIEFITTAKILDEYIGDKSTILDCAAGTGVYSFYFADKGHDVTATDITPRHIDIINKKLQEKEYSMSTSVMDATDLSAFADETFDVVLNMGPFYHLVHKKDRDKCFEESVRVLKNGGLLFIAYIPRYYVFQHIALRNTKYLDATLADKLIRTGELHHDDEKCFWTDSYYSTCEEMETLYMQHGLKLIDHFAQDGITPQFAEKADIWDDVQFQIWCDYHYSVCREKTLLGASNHVMVVGKKNF